MYFFVSCPFGLTWNLIPVLIYCFSFRDSIHYSNWDIEMIKIHEFCPLYCWCDISHLKLLLSCTILAFWDESHFVIKNSFFSFWCAAGLHKLEFCWRLPSPSVPNKDTAFLFPFCCILFLFGYDGYKWGDWLTYLLYILV